LRYGLKLTLFLFLKCTGRYDKMYINVYEEDEHK